MSTLAIIGVAIVITLLVMCTVLIQLGLILMKINKTLKD